MEIKEFLSEQDYKDCGYTTFHNYTLYQKRIKTDFGCDSNDGKLYINVKKYEFKQTINGEQLPDAYEVELCAEKHKIWWQLKTYSLNEQELKERLEGIEMALVNMFDVLRSI